MVREAPKPSLREASCCRVEVVKGGRGLRRVRFFSIEATVNGSPALIAATARLAAS